MKKLLLPIACTAVGVYDLLFGVSAFGFAIGWLPFSWGMVSLLAIGGWKAARRIEPKRGTILGAAALLAVWWWRNRPKQRAALQARIELLERSIWPERFAPREGVPSRTNFSQLMRDQGFRQPLLRQAMVEREISRARNKERALAAYEKRMLVKQARPAFSNLLDDLPTILCACGAAAKVSHQRDEIGRRWILYALCPNCHKQVSETINDFRLNAKPLDSAALAAMLEAYFRRLQATMANQTVRKQELDAAAQAQQALAQLAEQRTYNALIQAQALPRCQHNYSEGVCPYCRK